jgi:hypothetical protein
MKFHQLVLLLIITVIVCGCENKQAGFSYDKFPIRKNIELLEAGLSDAVYMRYPKKIIICDSLLFILDLNGTESFVHCYSYPSFDYICSLLKKGQGAGEAISINNIQSINDTLFAYDATNTVYSVEIKGIRSGTFVINKLKLPSNYGFLNKGIKIGPNYYFPTFNQRNDGRIIKFENDGKTVTLFGKINKDDEQEVDVATYQAWTSYLDGNDSILVAATQFGEVIDLFYLEKNYKQYTLKGKLGDPVFQNQNNYAINKGIMGFWDVMVTNRYIYTLFDGTKVTDQNINEQGGQFVYVFDYSGNPQIAISLDKRVVSLYVDEEGERIYFLDVNSDNPLYYMALPDILR